MFAFEKEHSKVAREHLESATLWSAPAKRSGDGAFVQYATPTWSTAVSRFACHRTP
jgi:hypothetical protein